MKFARIPEQLWPAVGLIQRVSTLKFWMALASYMGPDGTCFPGKQSLIDRTGLSYRSIVRARDELRNYGLTWKIRGQKVAEYFWPAYDMIGQDSHNESALIGQDSHPRCDSAVPHDVTGLSAPYNRKDVLNKTTEQGPSNGVGEMIDNKRSKVQSLNPRVHPGGKSNRWPTPGELLQEDLAAFNLHKVSA